MKMNRVNEIQVATSDFIFSNIASCTSKLVKNLYMNVQKRAGTSEMNPRTLQTTAAAVRAVRPRQRTTSAVFPPGREGSKAARPSENSRPGTRPSNCQQ